MEASCTVQTLRNSCKFFSESDKKKLARAISQNQVSDPGPSWPSCFFDRVEILWDKEKILVTSISTFPTMFSKGLVISAQQYQVKGLSMHANLNHSHSTI